MMGRRQFLQSSTVLLGAPLPEKHARPEAFAGSLARLVFLDDVAALTTCSLGVPGTVAQAIASKRELYLSAALLEAGPAAQPVAALAIRAGRAALQAYRSLEPSTPEGRLQWDARMLRGLAAREGLKPPAGKGTPELADLFETLSRRVLITIHTYIPDQHDPEGWMERLIGLHQAAHRYWKQLAKAYLQSSQAADEQFDASDAIIRVAAALHYGPLDTAMVAGALASLPRSAYGRALKEAHQGLLTL